MVEATVSLPIKPSYRMHANRCVGVRCRRIAVGAAVQLGRLPLRQGRKAFSYTTAEFPPMPQHRPDG